MSVDLLAMYEMVSGQNCSKKSSFSPQLPPSSLSQSSVHS